MVHQLSTSVEFGKSVVTEGHLKPWHCQLVGMLSASNPDPRDMPSMSIFPFLGRCGAAVVLMLHDGRWVVRDSEPATPAQHWVYNGGSGKSRERKREKEAAVLLSDPWGSLSREHLLGTPCRGTSSSLLLET